MTLLETLALLTLSLIHIFEVERSAAVEQLFEQFVLCSHSHPHFPVLLEFCNLIFPKKGRCPSWGLPPRGSIISQLIIQR